MSISGWFLRRLRRLRSQRDVPDVLTVRTEATPNRHCFIGQHGPSPLDSGHVTETAGCGIAMTCSLANQCEGALFRKGHHGFLHVTSPSTRPTARPSRATHGPAVSDSKPGSTLSKCHSSRKTVHFCTPPRQEEPVEWGMAISQLRRVTYVECPGCHWTRAVLAYESSQQRCVFCPRCQLMWDTTDIAREEHGRLTPRTTEPRKKPEVSIKIDQDLDRRVAEMVAQVRRTLALLDQEARVGLPALAHADVSRHRLHEPLLEEALPHDILKRKPVD